MGPARNRAGDVAPLTTTTGDAWRAGDQAPGFYAVKDLADLDTQAHRYLAGIVRLWGTVAEHERGWRAEHAQVVGVMFPRNGTAPAGARSDEEERQGFYFCLSLIQLLEDIYTDFNLQDRAQREHPHVKGWIGLYQAWLKSEDTTIEKTWGLVRNTYNSHFRAFWNDIH